MISVRIREDYGVFFNTILFLEMLVWLKNYCCPVKRRFEFVSHHAVVISGTGNVQRSPAARPRPAVRIHRIIDPLFLQESGEEGIVLCGSDVWIRQGLQQQFRDGHSLGSRQPRCNVQRGQPPFVV